MMWSFVSRLNDPKQWCMMQTGACWRPNAWETSQMFVKNYYMMCWCIMQPSEHVECGGRQNEDFSLIPVLLIHAPILSCVHCCIVRLYCHTHCPLLWSHQPMHSKSLPFFLKLFIRLAKTTRSPAQLCSAVFIYSKCCSEILVFGHILRHMGGWIFSSPPSWNSLFRSPSPCAWPSTQNMGTRPFLPGHDNGGRR